MYLPYHAFLLCGPLCTSVVLPVPMDPGAPRRLLDDDQQKTIIDEK